MTLTPEAEAFALSSHLSAYLHEHVASQESLILGGERYIPLLDPQDYPDPGVPGYDGGTLLLRRDADGAVFEVWAQAGAVPALRPAEVAQ